MLRIIPFSLLVFLIAHPAIAAYEVNWAQSDIAVSQDVGTVQIPIAISGSSTSSRVTVGYYTQDGTATSTASYGYETTFFNLFTPNSVTTKYINIPIKFTKSPYTTFFTVVLYDFYGSQDVNFPPPSAVKITILGWTPPQWILNKIASLRKKLERAQHISNPQRRRKTVTRFKNKIAALEAQYA